MSINSRLKAYEAANGPAKVAIVGAGYVGSGVFHTLSQSFGMKPALIVNRDTDKARNVIESRGIDHSDIVVSDNEDIILEAITANRFAICSDYRILAALPIDIVVEATGAIDYGTRVVLSALQARQHVVSYNAEVDSLLAWRFNEEASRNNVVYTIADGDQPGCLLRMAEEVQAMGFQIKALLNCKRHLDIYQNPSSGAGYANRDTTSSNMTTAFGDGTKMQVEQAVVANATGLVPSRRGMNGIKTTLEELTADVKNLWPAASLNDTKSGYVDYTLGGNFGAGVGIVAEHPEGEFHSKAMSLYKMGDGPDYFFFRPYHLVHLELPQTIAGILLHNEGLATVDVPHVAEVIAIAKKDLTVGDELDGIGGFSTYGLIEAYCEASQYLPIALSGYATLSRDVSKDQPIRLDAVKLDDTHAVVQEWHSQCQAFTLAHTT